MRGSFLCAFLGLTVWTGAAAAQSDSVLPDEPVSKLIEPITSGGSMPTLHDRYDQYLRRTYSWQRMSLLAVDTGVDSLLGDVAWGRGLDGFGCRYAHRFGRRVVGNSIEFAASAALREDLRYRPSYSPSTWRRVRHATTSAFMAYRDDGSRELAYARFAGYTGRAFVSATWCPKPITAQRIGMDAGFGVFDQVQNNLLSEFAPDLKRFGRRTWNTLRIK